MAPLKRKSLPVTLLSGFLGAGKTTLLKHILQSKDHGLRVAVIVNDMAALNIDASLIESRNLVQKEEKMVKMQNGCICCSLREDLVIEVTRLAAQDFDYLIIESTGISEPQQVAESFELEIPQDIWKQATEGLDKAKLKAFGAVTKLEDVAFLDNAVTVIDAAALLQNLASVEKLRDRTAEGEVDEHDQRTISNLMVDQIEFADTILLNKVDLVTAEQRQKLQGLITTLNPSAVVLPTRRSQVDLKEILGTCRFDMQKARDSAGWLKSLHEENPTTESAEYGIVNRVFRARRPFHPERLHDFLTKYFNLHEPVAYEEEGSDSEVSDTCPMDVDELPETPDMVMRTTPATHGFEALTKQFGQLLRAKGYIWIAGRDDISGEISVAGANVEVTEGGPFFAALPREAWPEEPEVCEAIMQDFEGETGDRRQEIVLIGIDLDFEAIEAALTECLVTDRELKQLRPGRAFSLKMTDPFAPWKTLDDYLVQEEEIEA